jgi:predicted phosphodiesterase
MTFVITHHLPSYKCIDEKYHGDPKNSFYASDLDYLMEKYKINYWIHGHTHVTVYKQIFNTRVICNPRGYCNRERENNNFNYSYVITI